MTSHGSLDETSLHEAGHLLIGHMRLGMIALSASTMADEGGTTGRCQWDFESVDRVRPFIGRKIGLKELKPGRLSVDEVDTARYLIALHLAGSIAVEVVSGHDATDRSRSDSAKATTLARYVNITDPNSVIGRETTEVASALGVPVNRVVLDRHARALRDQRELTQAEIARLLG